MKRLLSVMIGIASLGVYGGLPAYAQDPVADRAVAGAKEYIKAKNLKDPKLTILLSSLYNTSFPDFTKKWEALTGVKFEIVPLGYTDIPAKVMQEAVSKSGVYDIFNDFPYTMPDAAGAKVILPMDDWAKKYKPDFSGISPGLQFQQYYDGKLYNLVNDGDHLLLAVRKDLMENPQLQAAYKAKFNKDLACPDTMAEWKQQASFINAKAGETKWGIKFEKDLFGSLGYRSVNFSYRQFPTYMKGLLFDKDMKQRITTPDGIQAIKDFAASLEDMPKDIQGGVRRRSIRSGHPAKPTRQCPSLRSSVLATPTRQASSKASSWLASSLARWSAASSSVARRRPPAPATWCPPMPRTPSSPICSSSGSPAPASATRLLLTQRASGTRSALRT